MNHKDTKNRSDFLVFSIEPPRNRGTRQFFVSSLCLGAFVVQLFSFLAFAGAGNYEITTKVSGYALRILIDPNPPLAKGNNRLELEITDQDGAKVSDAKVMINYYMPPMPRMAPMNYRTEAVMKKGKYFAAMKFIMAGPWYIAVIVDHRGKVFTAKINVDAQ